MPQSQSLSPKLIAAHFNQAAPTYDQHAILQKEVAERLLSKLSLLKFDPTNILDIGAGTGEHTLFLQNHFPNAQVVGLDIAPNMMRVAKNMSCSLSLRPQWISANTFALPFVSHTIDLLFSNATLQWCLPLEPVLTEWARILRPQVPLFFSTFGPNTLKELRASWQMVSKTPHTNVFLSLQDIGKALLSAGFQDVVLEREEITITYSTVKQLLRDLKGTGSHNHHPNRSHRVTSRAAFQKMIAAYEQYTLQNGQIPATYEIIYGHAWSKK